VKSIQEKNDCVYTVLGTHWNTLYPDCVRNIHAVNGGLTKYRKGP